MSSTRTCFWGQCSDHANGSIEFLYLYLVRFVVRMSVSLLVLLLYYFFLYFFFVDDDSPLSTLWLSALVGA
jgi:hypothetical protein